MPSLIEDLQDPEALPDETKSIGLVQTHISIVFIGDNFVYKVKKPVNFGFLDFTTLEKRLHYCQKEVELNRRLSRDLYLGVLPVRFDGKRHSLREGPGEIVDYAVRMRRIPDHLLMKSVFQRGELKTEHLERIADALARFHRSAPRSPEIDAYGTPQSFRVNTDENFEQTRNYVGITIPPEDFAFLWEWTDDFYSTREDLFLHRIEEGRIRDCHGDLHMEHICLTEEEVTVFDCIEFNDRFRYGDTLSDIAFLIMDLEFHEGWDPARRLWKAYEKRAGERDVDDLLTFYKVYRAYVRGKVSSFQLDDPHLPPEEKDRAAQTAKRYFRLARAYLEGGIP
jgi:hypothetical protein